jgi:hypothetical protein
MRYLNPEALLNQSLVQYALHCSATKSVKTLAALGIEPEDLRDLLQMNGEDIARLSMVKESLFKIQFDQELWRRKRAEILVAGSDRQLCNALIAAGAPRSMIERWWPTRHADYAHLRRVWGIAGTGRPRRATEEEEQLLWQEWSAIAAGRPFETLGARDYLELHNRTNIDLNVSWSVTNGWISDGCIDSKTRRVGT